MNSVHSEAVLMVISDNIMIKNNDDDEDNDDDYADNLNHRI